MNKKSYFNTSLLLLHEKHLENYRLYELYLLRNRYLNNNNFIVENLNDKIINIIDNVISQKKNGIQLLEIFKKNNILYNEIRIQDNIKIRDNIKLIEFYKNINTIELLIGFKKDSLLSKEQLKNRFCLEFKIFVNDLIKKIMLCKFN